MNSLIPDYLTNVKFTADDLATLRALGELRGKQELFYQQSPELLTTLRETAIVESTEASNRIEGITAPPKRVAALVLKSAEPRNRSEQEIAGYRDALQLLHQSAEHVPFSCNVIRQLHGYLYRYHAGEGGKWKTSDNTISETLPDGSKRVRFEPTSAFDTPQAMTKLEELYSDAVQTLAIEPLLVIPATILDFLCIHPFRDGNGRTARILTLLLLYHHQFEVGRYISLERIIEESKESYYEALEKSSKDWHEGCHDLHPWLRYFWGTLLRAYREFEQRVGKLAKGRGRKGQQIRSAIEEQIAPFSISHIERLCPGVSRDTIRLVLRQMRDEGIIHSIGKGRGAKWVKR